MTTDCFVPDLSVSLCQCVVAHHKWLMASVACVSPEPYWLSSSPKIHQWAILLHFMNYSLQRKWALYFISSYTPSCFVNAQQCICIICGWSGSRQMHCSPLRSLCKTFFKSSAFLKKKMHYLKCMSWVNAFSLWMQIRQWQYNIVKQRLKAHLPASYAIKNPTILNTNFRSVRTMQQNFLG